MDKLADDVDWDDAHQESPNPVLWLQPQGGKKGVTGFFQIVQENLEIYRFGVNALAEGSDAVVALFDFEAAVKRTGNWRKGQWLARKFGP
ncbi:MAG: hypothetical protein D6814_17540 [Calditrichaeota bacterium]|nr:MAG: hypothetical protein D6814_17540 [Calditrichota bacterium]